MPYPVFTLQVPADATYQTIACEVASRYVDLAGGSETQRTAFHDLLTKTVVELTGGRAEDVEMSCMADPPGFFITLKCGGRSTIVRHPVPADKR